MNRMQILLLIGGLVLGSSYLYGQKNDLEKDHLMGNISSIRETIYSIPKKSNNKTQNIISDIIHNYNAAGNKIKSSIFKNDSLFSYQIYEYNKDSFTDKQQGV